MRRALRSPSSSSARRASRARSAPVPAWRALRVVAERGGRARSSSVEAPFVGRDAELNQLKNLLHATQQKPCGGHDPRSRRHRQSRLAWGSRSTSTAWSKPSTGITAARRPTAKASPSGRWARWSAGAPALPSQTTATTLGGSPRPRRCPADDERRWIEPALLALLGVEPPPTGGRESPFRRLARSSNALPPTV